MTGPEAKQCLRMLLAAYPTTTLDEDSVKAYGLTMAKHRLAVATAAVEQVIRECDRFPTLGQVSAALKAQQRRVDVDAVRPDELGMSRSARASIGLRGVAQARAALRTPRWPDVKEAIDDEVPAGRSR